jgi:hypothetical protein
VRVCERQRERERERERESVREVRPLVCVSANEGVCDPESVREVSPLNDVDHPVHVGHT